jgi:LCP family protein required for cell wall assembly
VASKDKPYRIYRGGRARGRFGRSPLAVREQLQEELRRGAPVEEAPGERDWEGLPGEPAPRRRRRWIVVGVAVVLLVLALVAGWATLGWLAFRSGVKEANARLDEASRRALAPSTGSILSSPTTLLLLGADTGPGRDGDRGRADAILLVRADPDEHRIAYLSIPRDLRVEIPGEGVDKVNAAYAIGGPALAVDTVEELTGLPVHHVAVVDFARFREVIDALGGVTVDVPRPIVSNRFECPFKTPAECNRWDGWKFERGEQRLDGRRALVYARIRENRLDPAENDLTRGGRQQQVILAIADEVASVNGFLRLPFLGDDLVRPLATDLSAWEIMQLGWVKFRAADGRTLRCRLGGVPVEEDAFYLEGTEENAAVIAMVTGDSAPQPPPPGTGPFGPGCAVGG